MKIVERKTSAKKSKKSVVNYSSWDPLTQAKYLFELGQQIGPQITMAEAYQLALKATQHVSHHNHP